MRKTRLVIQPTRCLHAIGFLLLYMSCPVFGDWGLVQPESAAAQRANSLQRESAKMVLKDPPDSRVSQQPDPSAWAHRTDLTGRNILSSERRWLDVRNQRMSPERRESFRDATRDRTSRTYRGTRQIERLISSPKGENRRIENSRRLSKQSAEGGNRLHLEERLTSPSRRLVRGEVQSESKNGIRVIDSTRQISQMRFNQRLLKNVRTSFNNDQRRSVRRTEERTQERIRSSTTLRRGTENIRESQNEVDQRQTSSSIVVNNRSLQKSNRRTRENIRSQERENINSREEVGRRSTLSRRTARSIDERREENRSTDRLEATSRTLTSSQREMSTNVRERNDMRTGDRKSSQENRQVRQARENRISNMEEAFIDAQRRENRRVAERIENIEIRSRRTTERSIRNNNENREEYSSRRINSSIRTRDGTRDRNLDRNERQHISARADVVRARQDYNQQRITIRQNTEQDVSSRASRSRSELSRMEQGDNRRTQLNGNDKKLSVRRTDQDTLRRSTRSLNHRNTQRSDELLMRSRVDIRDDERERFGHRNDARNIKRVVRSQDSNIRSNRQHQVNSIMANNEVRLTKSASSHSQNVREQRESSLDRRMERRAIRENDYRKERRVEARSNSRNIQEQRKSNMDRHAEMQVIREMRVEGKANMEREVRDTIRSMPLVRNQRIAMVLEKESVMRNSLNEIRFSPRKENNNNRETTKAVELSKDVRGGREMFSKKPYTQDSVDQLFQENSDNWISYKKIAGNCLLGAIAYFVTTRNPKIAY